MVRKVLLLVLFATFSSGTGLWAQRSDAAARTAQNVEMMQAAANAEIPTLAEEQANTDLGEQWTVDSDSGAVGLYGSAQTALFYTSNANLTPGSGSGDMYFYARGVGGLRPHLGGGLYLNGYVSQEVFDYAKYSSLDFLRFSTGGGLEYVIPGTNGLLASVSYRYERFLDSSSFDEFYVNNAIDVSLSKEFSLSDVQAVQVGWLSSFAVYAEPSISRRDEHNFWLGWRWRIIDPLELQVYNVLSLYYYPNISDRFDVTNYSGASLNLNVTSWATISASAGFAVNSSSQSIYNYTAANVGGSLSLNFSF